MTRIRTLALGAVLIALAACSQPTPPTEIDALGGQDGKEMVDRLDRLGAADRPTDVMASVRYDEVIVTDGEDEVRVSLPDEEFYVSLAPYVETTHECYYHSLTTCQGELAERDIEVTITTDDGEVLVEETTTTFANGFVGYWLPRDIQGTLAVSYDGLSGEVPLATGSEDPTCITTLQLT